MKRLPVTIAHAPGKVILFGEHAVVYGRPAIAVPVTQVRATATLRAAFTGQGIRLHAEDLNLERPLDEVTGPDDPLYPMAATVRNTLCHLGVGGQPDLILQVSSTVPMARGLGSGAAVGAAIVRVLAKHFDSQVTAAEVSDLVYQTELIHHGTPSGIDNTVIAFEQPVFFVRGQAIQVLRVGAPFWLVIGDTGIASPTRIAVADVRQSWQQDPDRYESLFDAMGSIAVQARQAMTTGDTEALGPWMDENQRLLESIGVSCPELEQLIAAARQAGAWGAKLCGGGLGGNMIALVAPDTAEPVATAMRLAGAVNTIITCIDASRLP